jgi:hypothetical protein
MKQARSHKLVRPLVFALALAVPGAAALAESMDVVHTRDANVQPANLGRAGGSAVVDSRDAALEAQQEQAGEAAWDKTKVGAEKAWDATKSGAATAYTSTKAFVTQKPAVPPNEPQRYGRAGGFIGVEQFEVPQPGVTMLGSAPANADAVKSGESQWGYTNHTATSAAAKGTQSTGASEPSDARTSAGSSTDDTSNQLR